MATSAPKSVPKIVPSPEPVEQAPAPKKSKKLLVILTTLALSAGSAGVAWYFMGQDAVGGKKGAAKHAVVQAPVFIVLEPFTVNLQSEAAEQFLQVALTLQVADQAQVDLVKLHMPQVRNRLLLLLSSKQASEILTVEGKKKLADEIILAMKQPFMTQSPPQAVSNVFFTSFVIQ